MSRLVASEQREFEIYLKKLKEELLALYTSTKSMPLVEHAAKVEIRTGLWVKVNKL